MKNLLKYFFLFLLICITLQSSAYCAIKITPNKFEFKAKENQKYITGAFSVETNGDENIRFKVYPDFFEISNEGLLAEGNKDAANSLVRNIRFSPNEFTVSPGTTQIVRFTITDVKNLPDGESRVVLFLEDTKTKEIILQSANKDISPKIIVKTRAIMPIYVDKGNIVKAGEIETLKIDKNTKGLNYLMQVKATGNSKIRVSGKVRVIKDKKLTNEFLINSRAIQAGTTSNIMNSVPTDELNNGEYILKVILNYADQDFKNKNIVKETNFKVENGKL